jgi:hypothetical protein
MDEFIDMISFYLPMTNNDMIIESYVSGSLGLIGINNMEIVEIKHRKSGLTQKLIVEKLPESYIVYSLLNDKIKLDRTVPNLSSNEPKQIDL